MCAHETQSYAIYMCIFKHPCTFIPFTEISNTFLWNFKYVSLKFQIEMLLKFQTFLKFQCACFEISRNFKILKFHEVSMKDVKCIEIYSNIPWNFQWNFACLRKIQPLIICWFKFKWFICNVYVYCKHKWIKWWWWWWWRWRWW